MFNKSNTGTRWIYEITSWKYSIRRGSREEISQVRTKEAANAVAILDGTYYCLGCDDIFILYDRPTLLKAIELIRKVKPTIVFAPSPQDYMMDTKEKMLCCHASQRDWLLKHHGMDGFKVIFYDTIEDFYLAEALEYIDSWKQATADNPVGVCGPIGPTEQLPLVARLVNALDINLSNCHFWGMDEWFMDGKEVPPTHPLSFERADREMCFGKIKPELRVPEENLHFPKADTAKYIESWDGVRCGVMQGGQGDIKHWAFNDPLRREGKYKDNPPAPEEYRQFQTRVVELHPVTIMQNARTSGGGVVTGVPNQAITVGPVQTWQAEKVSIWQAGAHDNAFGMRLTALMISNKIADSSVPMSHLADAQETVVQTEKALDLPTLCIDSKGVFF